MEKTVAKPTGRNIYDQSILVPVIRKQGLQGLIEEITRIPNIREVVLLDFLDAAGSSGVAWIPESVLYSPRKNALKRLAEYIDFFKQRGISSRTQLEISDDIDIPGTLFSVAAREHSSLIVIPYEARTRIVSVFFENDALRLLRQCRMQDMLICPVNNAGRKEESIFSRVLVPVDFSSISHEAFFWAASHPAVREIVVLHVVSKNKPVDVSSASSEAEREMDKMVSGINTNSLAITRIICTGDPPEEIARVGMEQEVSLILMPRCGLDGYVKEHQLSKTVTAVASDPDRPLWIRVPRLMPKMKVRELGLEEFPMAEQLWTHYHNQKADRVHDRIFGVFLEGVLVSVAWCKRHPDGLEVDGVFTLEDFRRHGCARKAMEALVATCGNEALYMHSTLELVEFYKTLGFIPIPENELPPSIKERFDFALGNLEGANARPMRRGPFPEEAALAGISN